MKIVELIALFASIACCSALPRKPLGESIHEIDPELSGGHYQGDILIDSDDDRTRNVMKNETYRWPNNTVYYHISSYIDEKHRNHILRGLRIIEENSCIVFKEATTDQEYYVNVTSEPKGCFSYIGHQRRVQQLNLQDYELDVGCFRLGTIVHEFLHALGIYHQQSAANRDEHVRIVEENIEEDKLFNFEKYTDDEVDDFGEEYDYSSVMHYGPYAFSANGEMTIVPLQAGAEALMGQRLRMTSSDINKLNVMYRCPVKV